LARLRQFFDILVTRHAAPLNPFQSVRGRKHDTSDDKTPGHSIQQARNLLGSIDTSHVVSLRDRAVPGTLAWTGARVGAIARLRRPDLEGQGTQRVLRFQQMGGKQREIPARHELDCRRRRVTQNIVERISVSDAFRPWPAGQIIGGRTCRWLLKRKHE